jgi:AcrR family transcriptional regulator
MADKLCKDILKTATKLFFKFGLRSVSIEDICNELRISKKTFYTCFSQKEALIEDILVDYDESFAKRMELKIKSLNQPESATVIDLVLFFSVFHLMNRDAQFENFFFDMQKYYPEVFIRHMDRHRHIVTDYIRDMLLKGIEQGLYRTDLEVDLIAGIITLELMSVMEFFRDKLNKNEQQKVIMLVTDLHMRSLCNELGLNYYLQALSKIKQKSTE